MGYNCRRDSLPRTKERSMWNRISGLVLGATVLFATVTGAADYVVDISVYRGNPKALRNEASSSTSTMRVDSGSGGVLSCRRVESINRQQIVLGEAVWFKATDVGHGAIKFDLGFAYNVCFGNDDAPGSFSQITKSTWTV